MQMREIFLTEIMHLSRSASDDHVKEMIAVIIWDKFKEAGIEMTVTPTIQERGTLLLDIENTLSGESS